MNISIKNRVDVRPSNPVKTIIKRTVDFTTKSNQFTTYFIATNAALAGYATGFAFETYGILSAVGIAVYWLLTVVFWRAT